MRKFILAHPVLSFTLLGFMASLGAPLGFYLHNFVFGYSWQHTFIEHILWLHKHNFSTILYIGMGTNIFFTLFGYLTGSLLQKLLESYKQNELQEKRKTKLTFFFLLKARSSTTVGLESLFFLEKHRLPTDEHELVINNAIERLRKLDHDIRKLVNLYNGPSENDELISGEHLHDLFKKIILNSQIDLDIEKDIFSDKNSLINLNLAMFETIIEDIVDWFVVNEIEIDKISIGHFSSHPKKTFFEKKKPYKETKKNLSYIFFEFNISNDNGPYFDAPLIFELVEDLQGRYYFEPNSVCILLPEMGLRQLTDDSRKT